MNAMELNRSAMMNTANAHRKTKSFKDFSVLYVEDDEEIREQLTHFLRRRVGTLYTATNGREGLESFRAHHPDIVVSDIRMPEMDGLDMVAAIKHDHPGTPVIMTTAFNETDYFLKAIDIGVDKYVMKPVKIDILVDAIDRSAHALQAERNLRLAATVFDTAAEAIIIIDRARGIVAANPACAATLGYPADALVGFQISLLDAPVEGGERGLPWEEICGAQAWQGEVWLKRGGGDRFPAWLSVGGAKTPEGELTHHVLVFLDISEQKRREAEILGLNAELRAARDELERRVEERTRELVRARDAAESANRAKSQFLSHMSHELRTPMNAILGFTELLHTDTDHPLCADQKDCTKEILSAGRHLLDLINDVLDLARVEAGKLNFSSEPAPLGDIFGECLDLIRPLAAQRGIRIDICRDKLGPILVKADRIRLKQVLINLLSNAVKYNKDDGRIDIECQEMGSRLRLGVSDTGLGIDAEDIQRLFQPFERFGEAMKLQEGAGIGLALSRRLVDLMGGSITVESQPGRGSTFWLELDRATESELAEVVSGGDMPEVAEERLACLNGRCILYVEGNPANLEFMRALFRKIPKARLITAERPEQGLELAFSEKPDFILLDIGLPGMDGYELLACLREHEELKSTPIVALSANAMPEEQARGIEAGFDDYLAKPARADELLVSMERLLCRKKGNAG
jgi:PAS domain S-box-containing protein